MVISIGYIKHPNEYIRKDDYIILRIISDMYGTFDFIIDIDEYDRVKQYHWGIAACKSNNGDYVEYLAHHQKIFLHRFIVNAPNGTTVDHIDGNSLDTRKSDLRICTQKENGKNRKKNKNNKTGVKGVIWNTYAPTPKWQAYIMVDYHHKSLGYYDSFNDAVNARKQAEIKYFGEYNRKLDNVSEPKINKTIKTSDKYKNKPTWKTIIVDELYVSKYNGFEYIIQKDIDGKYDIIKKINNSEKVLLYKVKTCRSAKSWLTNWLKKNSELDVAG